jgi:hypothetical protein
MHKGMGKTRQVQGYKRYKKVFARKKRKHENVLFLVKLMNKYGVDLKLKQKTQLGEKYWESLIDYESKKMKEKNA